MCTTYCLGFAFAPDLQNTLLIEKKRPAWQAGLLNGVGGHVESNETPEQAMTREFMEETGIPSTAADWTYTGTLEGNSFLVYVFTTDKLDIAQAQSLTDEPIRPKPIAIPPTTPIITNVPALIHLCRAKLLDPAMDKFVIEYN